MQYPGSTFILGSVYSRSQIITPTHDEIVEDGSATRYYGALAAAMILIFSFGLCIVYREQIREWWNRKILGSNMISGDSSKKFQPIDPNATSPFHDIEEDNRTI